MDKKILLLVGMLAFCLFVRPVDATFGCWQDRANVSTSCGGLSTGSYAFVGTFVSKGNLFDSDWGTYGAATGVNASAGFYINYTKPIGALSSSTWLAKKGSGAGNSIISIPSNCWSHNTSTLSFFMNSSLVGSSKNVTSYCLSDTGWVDVLSGSCCIYNEIYEEGMDWVISYQNLSALTNCSIGYPSLTFTNLRESNQTSMNASLDITLNLNNPQDNQSNNYSFSFPSNTTQNICIYPNWASYQVNATATYSATGFSQRHYYLVNANISNQTQNINLYLLDNSLSTLITTQVIDRNLNPISDVIIKAQKYYVGSNNYQTVAEGHTDFGGNDYIYLNVYDTFYKFVLEKNGQALAEFAPLTIGSTTLSLPVGNATRGEYWSYYGTVASNCYYTNATAILRCDFSDTSGLMQTVNMTVQRFGMVSGWTDYCSDNATSTSATLICSIDNTGSYLYHYQLWAVYPQSSFAFNDGDIDLTNKYKPYGDVGVISGVMIIGTVALMGLPYSFGIIVFTTIAIIIVVAINFVSLGNIYFDLITIALIAAVMIWKLRERRWE